MSEAMIPRKEIPAAVRRITGGAKNPHEQTVRRWYSKGVRGVRLEVTYVGGEVFTTHRAIVAFFRQVQIAADASRFDSQPQPTARRRFRGKVNAITAQIVADRVLTRLGRINTAQTLADQAAMPQGVAS